MPDHNGVTIAAWSGRRAADALEQVRRNHAPKRTKCVICHQRINYATKGRRDSLSVQHLRSRRDFPHLTWEPSNWAPAHLYCNIAAGPGGQSTDIGLTS